MPRDVIIFAGALYDSLLWTNRQHVATRLADRGWRVLYVEPRLFWVRMIFGRFPGTRGRWCWKRRIYSPWHPRPNLWVIAQENLIPGSRRNRWISRFNRAFTETLVRIHAWLRGFQDPAVLLYDTEAAQSLPGFPISRVVYDCVDDHRAQEGVNRQAALVEEEEAAIVTRADAIAVTTEPLFQRFRRVHSNVHMVPNAADIPAFLAPPPVEPKDMAAIGHPRIGLVGALDAYKIDVALLSAVMRDHPLWQFVFVGPVGFVGKEKDAPHLQALRALPNAHFLGPKSRGRIPAYVQAFDVATIPYRESRYNASSFPLKFWEFMASGKPIVASGLPSLRPYAHLARLAASAGEFSAAIDAALAERPDAKLARINEAKKHDWATRVDALERLLLS